MTESEWEISDEPHRLLGHLRRPAGDRKLLLYAVACCHANWDLLTRPASRAAVEWAELFADYEVERDERYSRLEYESEGAAFALEGTTREQRRDDLAELVHYALDGGDIPQQLRSRVEAGLAPRVRAAYFANALLTLDTQDPYDPTLSAHRSLLLEEPLRDIFGNPFRSAVFSPEWRTDTVMALAREMYESRDFGAMPILGDALQDAGCDNPDILSHCRHVPTRPLSLAKPGERDERCEHVRGCWVVDLVLGKE
jgi:hypothetical protein